MNWESLSRLLSKELRAGIERRAALDRLPPGKWAQRVLFTAADTPPSGRRAEVRPRAAVRLFPWRWHDVRAAASEDSVSIAEWVDETLTNTLITRRRKRLDSGPLVDVEVDVDTGHGEPLSGAWKSLWSAVSES